MIQFHYTFQACDTKSNQGEKRYCGDDRTLLSKKSLTSFLNSVAYAANSEQGKDSTHNVMVFADACSEEYIDYIYDCINYFSCDRIKVDITINRGENGLMKTVRDCWNWLEQNGKDVVYQIQDDYIFFESAIEEMATVLFQTMQECNHHPIVIPYNNPYFWLTIYRFKSIPSVVIPSAKRYWIQAYDTPCTFMTTKPQFSRHWDIYEKFLNMSSTHPTLEPETLNKIFVDRKVLGLQPVTSVALHMQAETEKDPYIDWQSLWDSINLV